MGGEGGKKNQNLARRDMIFDRTGKGGDRKGKVTTRTFGKVPWGGPGGYPVIVPLGVSKREDFSTEKKVGGGTTNLLMEKAIRAVKTTGERRCEMLSKKQNTEARWKGGSLRKWDNETF